MKIDIIEAQFNNIKRQETPNKTNKSKDHGAEKTDMSGHENSRIQYHPNGQKVDDLAFSG